MPQPDDKKVRVLRVYQNIHTRDSLRIESGQQVALCLLGRKHMLCVTGGYPVHVLKRPASDFDKLRRVVQHDKETGKLVEYPVDRAIAHYEQLGVSNGITKGAAALLVKAKNATELTDEEETQLENEEDITMHNENPNPTGNEGEKGESSTTTEGIKSTEESEVKKTAKKKAPAKKAAKVKKTKTPAAKAASNKKTNDNPTEPKEGTKKARAFEMLKAEFATLTPAQRKEPERGWRSKTCDKIAKKLGWKTGAAVADYYAAYVKLHVNK